MEKLIQVVRQFAIADEKDLSHFGIEKNLDGRTFEALLLRPSPSERRNAYQFSDIENWELLMVIVYFGQCCKNRF